MAIDATGRAGAAIPRDDLDALLAARDELGASMEPDVTAAFLARVEQAVVDRAAQESEAAVRRNRFTQRIAWSLGLGLPLVSVGGLIGGASGDGSSFGAVAGMAVTLAAVLGLNVYYTEVEKQLELARLYRRRR